MHGMRQNLIRIICKLAASKAAATKKLKAPKAVIEKKLSVKKFNEGLKKMLGQPAVDKIKVSKLIFFFKCFLMIHYFLRLSLKKKVSSCIAVRPKGARLLPHEETRQGMSPGAEILVAQTSSTPALLVARADYLFIK